MFLVRDANAGATLLWNTVVRNIVGWSSSLPVEVEMMAVEILDQTKVKRSGLDQTPGSYTEYRSLDCLASAVAGRERLLQRLLQHFSMPRSFLHLAGLLYL